ncbi:MAG: ketoacyl-ACP synthase III, partial [Flavobacterium sp.]
VATIPTLIDLVLNNKVEGYKVNKGEYAVFASVGAGMHINAIVYKF